MAFESAADLAGMFDTADFAEEARYLPHGGGPAVDLRVIRSSPDVMDQAFGTSIIQATDVVTVQAALVPGLGPGDIFEIAAQSLVVTHVVRDVVGATWKVFCRR